MSLRAVSSLLRSARGAFDLPSIITGVVVVAILTSGVFAAVFGVIPFAQDNGARQDVSSIRTAEAVARTKDGKFLDHAGLVSAGYLTGQAAPVAGPGVRRQGQFERVSASPGLKSVAGVNTAGDCYLALGKSGTGRIFWGSDITADPRELVPADNPGCLTQDELTALVESIGGFGGMYAPLAPSVAAQRTDMQAAVFTWGAVPTATGYRVESRTNGREWVLVRDDQAETIATVTAGPSDVVDVRVAARNAAGTSGYGTATARLKDPVIANGGFENALASWTATGSGATKQVANGRTGTGAASITSTATLSQNIVVPANVNSTLKFWHRADSNYGEFYLQVKNPTTGAVLGTLVSFRNTAGAAWNLKSAALTQWQGQAVTLAFTENPTCVYEYSCNYVGGTILLDDLSVETSPATASAAPTNVNASAEDGVAYLSWTAPASLAVPITGYTVTPYVQGSAQASFEIQAPATTATATGLANGTGYTFTVKATNSAGTSPESAPSQMVTPAKRVITNATFDVSLYDWTVTGSGATKQVANGRTGTGAASITSTATLSQTIVVPANVNSNLKFWHRSDVSSGNFVVQVKNPTTGAVLGTLVSFQNAAGAAWNLKSAALTQWQGQTVTLAFTENTSCYDPYGYGCQWVSGTTLLDDLSIETAP